MWGNFLNDTQTFIRIFFFLLIKSSGKKYFYNIFLSRVRHSRRKSAAKNKCKEYWKWGHINSLTHSFVVVLNNLISCADFTYIIFSLWFISQRSTSSKWMRMREKHHTADRCKTLLLPHMMSSRYAFSFLPVVLWCIQLLHIYWHKPTIMIVSSGDFKKHFLWVYLNRFLEEKKLWDKFF